MPEFKPDDTEKTWLERCVPVRVGEGDSQDQAVAACMGMWREHNKSLDESLVVLGGAVKALGNGKIGGYLVKFSTDADPDLVGDFFTKETEFGQHTSSPVFYAHGADEVLKRRILGQAKLTEDDFGVWAAAQLHLRDDYEKFLYGMAEKGKLGWSSGTVAHLVERTQVGKAYRIDRWSLGLDASLTPQPAEPRAVVIPLKSYADGLKSVNWEVAGQAEPDEPEIAAPVVHIDKEGGDMTPEEMKAFEERLEARFGSLDSALKTTGESVIALAKKFEDNPGGFDIEEDGAKKSKREVDRPFKSLGEQLMAIKEHGQSHGRNTAVTDKLFKVISDAELKALGMNEEILSEGGFLLQPEFSAELFQRAYETGAFASRARRIPIGDRSNSIRINAIDETSRVTGSRFGGIQMYWVAAGGSLSATKPKLRQISLRLNKLMGAYYATDEEMQDATALGSVMSDAFTNEAAFMLDEAILFGAGNGQPLGVMNSPALVTVPKEPPQAAATVVLENIVKMWARLWAKSRPNSVWFINQDVEPQLDLMGLSVGLGGVPAYLPPGGIADAPYGRLKGRPVILTENSQTVGTLGDIVLADLSQYFLAVKSGVEAASSIHVAFLTDESVFRFVYRVDGQPIWNAPLVPAKGSNSLSPFVALAARA
jgi:HK97 family phage major capsid protein